jgi:hypothetical protein
VRYGFGFATIAEAKLRADDRVIDEPEDLLRL